MRLICRGKMKAISHFQLLFIISCLLLIQSCNVNAVKCPQKCVCTWILDSLEVGCTHRDLNVYPNLNKTPVEYLDLSFNYFTEFPIMYADIESLIHLDLSNNKIDYIAEDALIGFASLRTLLLANNFIRSWTDINPNEAFTYATGLKRLSLSGNELTTFNNDDADKQLISKTLIQLELANCAITSAGGDHLMNYLPSLERLILNHNKLKKLIALPSRSLRILEISNCSLQRLSTQLIEGLPNLEALSLSWNTALQFGGFNELNEEIVISSQSINYLDVSFCNLDDINLSGLPHLATVRLRGNMLRTLNAKTFANNTLLEVVDLSRNALRNIEVGTLVGLKRLARLDLAYNEIARLDSNTFRGNDVLMKLNLSRNVIDKFTKLTSNSLREINLSWCEITTIDSTALSELSVIQRLDMSNNFIRDIPNQMITETLQVWDLSNNRLSTVRNGTFNSFPKLASLRLNGNRFTNPIPVETFKLNKYLDEIWLSDNPWICSCHDVLFTDFYDYLTTKPQKLRDKNSLRCASPANFYGKTWSAACASIWEPNSRNSKAEDIWTSVMLCIMGFSILIFVFMCLKKFMKSRKHRNNRREYDDNVQELQQIQRLNQRILQEEPSSTFMPSVHELSLPSYEDALRMPKLERPSKSLGDLTATVKSRNKQLLRSQTDPVGETGEADNDLQLDTQQKFRSVEILSNRDKERIAQYVPYQRRTGRIDHHVLDSRHFGIEDSRFPPAHVKSQNLQSAEQIGNFQSYENSPYTKRKPKIAEIPPFKRANLMADSVEFLTDPEYEEINSKPASPFAKRKPKSMNMQTTAQVYTLPQHSNDHLAPAIEDYFSATQEQDQHSISSESNDFHLVVEPNVTALTDDNHSNGSTLDVELNQERSKRRKRKNSSNRRVSGSFSVPVNESDSTSSEREPMVVVQKPMRETIL